MGQWRWNMNDVCCLYRTCKLCLDFNTEVINLPLDWYLFIAALPNVVCSRPSCVEFDSPDSVQGSSWSVTEIPLIFVAWWGDLAAAWWKTDRSYLMRCALDHSANSWVEKEATWDSHTAGLMVANFLGPWLLPLYATVEFCPLNCDLWASSFHLSWEPVRVCCQTPLWTCILMKTLCNFLEHIIFRNTALCQGQLSFQRLLNALCYRNMRLLWRIKYDMRQISEDLYLSVFTLTYQNNSIL